MPIYRCKELLHNCFPDPPQKNCTKTAAHAPIFHNNIRKVGSFRNPQVSGSSPLVGSILLIGSSLFIVEETAKTFLLDGFDWPTIRLADCSKER
jgi:hypothetical protein